MLEILGEGGRTVGELAPLAGLEASHLSKARTDGPESRGHGTTSTLIPGPTTLARIHLGTRRRNGLQKGDDPQMAKGEAAPERRLRTGRLEAFSDGVFAVAITLLVLEISVPAGSEDDLLDAVVDQWHSYLAYIVSFSTIGALWLAHSATTDYLHQSNARLVRLNLLLLMVVSFLPFPTRLLADYLGETDAARVAATIYGLTLLVAVVLLSILWRYAVSEGLVRPDTADEEIQTLTTKLTPGLGGYVVMIVVGLFLPTVRHDRLPGDRRRAHRALRPTQARRRRTLTACLGVRVATDPAALVSNTPCAQRRAIWQT